MIQCYDKPNSHRHSGFTLLEILVVIAIITVLVAIGVTAMSTVTRQQDVTSTRNIIIVLENSVTDFQSERQALPSVAASTTANATNYVNSLVGTDKGLATLLTLEKAKAVILNRSGGVVTGVASGPVDLWGQPIRMSGDATQRWFWSIGPLKTGVVQTDDSIATNGNPVLKDDIGGNVNSRK